MLSCMTHKTREEYTSFLLTARRLDYSDFRCCITPWILHRWLFSLVPRHAVFNQCGAIWPRSPTNSGQTRANERWNRAVLLTFYHIREISTLFRVIADKRGISRTKILLLFFFAAFSNQFRRFLITFPRSFLWSSRTLNASKNAINLWVSSSLESFRGNQLCFDLNFSQLLTESGYFNYLDLVDASCLISSLLSVLCI